MTQRRVKDNSSPKNSTISDGGDVIAADDNFNSNVNSAFTYDYNGNMTADGVWLYKYDAWNRLVEAAAGSLTNNSWAQTAAYLGDHRRARATSVHSYTDASGHPQMSIYIEHY